MAVRRVFVIWTNPLFHESARLLLKHPDVIWMGSTADVRAAPDEIMRLHPDTVIYEKTQADIPSFVMEILEGETREIRIIGLSLEDNEMSLFHHEHQQVVKASDLLHFVLG